MNKIGIVGYSANTGLGEFVRQSNRYLNITTWLIYPHKTKKIIDQESKANQIVYTGKNSIERFLKSIDTVLFFETPLIPELIPMAKALGKRIVCVPMFEWLPETGWISDVDLFICPNKYSYSLLCEKLPCVLFEWPIDTERFQFKYSQEELEKEITLNTYLYVHGTGGYKDRKGEFVIKDMLTSSPELAQSIFVVTEKFENWVGFLPKEQIICSGMSNKDIYSLGDCLVAPHRLDGHGLQQYEALATGLPVIVSDGPVWAEYPVLAKCPGETIFSKIKRPVEWFNPDSEALGRILKENLGKNLSENLKEVVSYVEKTSWTTAKSSKLQSLVTGEPSGEKEEIVRDSQEEEIQEDDEEQSAKQSVKKVVKKKSVKKKSVKKGNQSE